LRKEFGLYSEIITWQYYVLNIVAVERKEKYRRGDSSVTADAYETKFPTN
jgi:hypothetical protein